MSKRKKFENNDSAGFSNDDDDYVDSEYISVYDAADIWICSGRDEDYMFGYTEDELLEAYNS